MTDQDDPQERRTEGVRIIGAQEAAEAAARPDVVRRRRGSEKRYGDRPDTPAPASDLPKITISTTEGDPGDPPDRFGAVPAVRPGADAADPGAPNWADDDRDRGRGFGHARILDDEPEQSAEPAATSEPAPGPDEGPARRTEDDLELTQPYSTHAERDDEPEDELFSTPGGAVSDEFATSWAQSEDETASWSSSEPGSWSTMPEPSAAIDEQDADLHPPVAGATGDGDDELFAELDDDSSFVLPHWTEPPTGQVPKVVIGDEAAEAEQLATYGSQPRWRDEGERTGAHDFGDLVDDGPSLGALGNDDDSLEDDFFGPDEDDRYLDDLDDEYIEDDFYDEPDDEAATRVARRGAPPDTGGGGGDRNLVTAVGVGVGLVAIGLLCFYLGSLTTTILATVVVTIAALEYFTAVRSVGHNPATLLGIVAVAGLMVATSAAGLAAYPVVLGLTVICGLLWYLWVAPGEGAVPNLGLTLLGVAWVGVLGSFATLFLGLGRAVEDASADIVSNPGIGVLIAAVIASVSHDVGAYFIGRSFGRTPLSAASPNKTQEGLAGGVLVSLVVTFVAVGFGGIDPIGSDLAQAFVFALLCALVAPLGDLSESFIKRDLRIKDMGTVLPGHGGVLDRFDALLFVLPVAYFVTVLFDIWSIPS